MFVSFSHRFLPFASNAGIFEGLPRSSLRPSLSPSLINHDLLSRNNLRLGGAVPSLSELLSQSVLVF